MKMQVSSASTNINAMAQAQSQMNDLSQKVADITHPATVTDHQNTPVTNDLLNAITEQIPTQIAYEASGTAIKVENSIQETLLDIKA